MVCFREGAPDRKFSSASAGGRFHPGRPREAQRQLQCLLSYLRGSVCAQSFEMLKIVCVAGDTTRMNLFQSLTSAMDIALEKDPTAGETHFHNTEQVL